ncbi:hypothetical protein ALC62_15744 [Cyphomyrmex costatus]|uniref:DNA-directed DNA polymerase n=1 Tax=Cyphomyrmex costatus TaxID=456900 RepID=A0A151I6L8_9HYME|nr:hypothetical protein ALC62_15744 [Cyphomyrmex costatus]
MLKRAVINVQSKDTACFAWSVVAALHPAKKNVERKSSYSHYLSVLNLTGIEFPMTLNQIKKFENLNDISINVYAIEDGIVPIRLADRKRNKHVNLLYVQDDIEGHFALINNLSRLVRSQISKKKNRKYFCDRCLHYFGLSAKLELHSVDCGKLNDCAVRLPSEDDKWLSFRNHCRKERVPFVVYADLECSLEKTDKDPTTSTYTYQHHNVFSIAYYIHCSYDDSLSGYRFRRDNNCISWFADELKNLAHSVQSIISTNVPMDFTRDDCEKFNSATHCHVCEKPFAKDDKRARDHCHLTGRYRGPAHSNCNLNYKDSRCIPVVFHNLTGYDAHFIIKEIATAYEGHVDFLPITKEKYISFTKHVDDTIDDKKNCIQLRFIDSYRFLASSLDKLSSFLSKYKLRILRLEFSHLSEENFSLLTRKGVFPYEYIDCSEKLNESCLPPRDSFYCSLTDATVSESAYAHAVNVWQRFSIQTLGEYSDLYLKTDVLLLADIFENFRVYKLMNNAVFGKTMENVRDRVDVKLLTKWEGRYGSEAMIAKPNFHSCSVFSENLVAIELRKLEVKFDKPIYVGMCILDISKTCLYEFHHEYMAPLFHDKCKIMNTDTDSLIYHVECDDIYEIIKRDIDRFDTSDYSVDNPYSIPLANKKVPGLMKDENNGAIMTEFVGLRAKMYALRVRGKKDTKKAKGVKSNVVARSITFDDYTRCLHVAMLAHPFIGLHFTIEIRHFDRLRLVHEPHIFALHKKLEKMSRAGLFIELRRA